MKMKSKSLRHNFNRISILILICFFFVDFSEAVETRHALHGIRWPTSNPKCLNVDFGTESLMEKAIASTADDVKPSVHARDDRIASSNEVHESTREKVIIIQCENQFECTDEHQSSLLIFKTNLFAKFVDKLQWLLGHFSLFPHERTVATLIQNNRAERLILILFFLAQAVERPIREWDLGKKDSQRPRDAERAERAEREREREKERENKAGQRERDERDRRDRDRNERDRSDRDRPDRITDRRRRSASASPSKLNFNPSTSSNPGTDNTLLKIQTIFRPKIRKER